ncbi:18S rRNA (guanine-N(7))-methyltransferase-like [Oopsacas minuta]|uniref:18S rRNA (guanine-N(7))-methyltransferase n=1 Tax=Oopsacas minuta TaxID=111878 RepID=A0AAV7JC77_9METZ|nr:18S rRNA (guanine-N(7))-methyltransferase-like [Oopsacas minuta]
MSHRPEHTGPAELYYNSVEARKYTQNGRIIEVQLTMTQRAVEILNLPADCPQLLLDIGCGSGLSGEYITEQGHHWVGLDISQAMLDVAREREVDGDLLLGDMGQGVPFRPGVFDGAISISAVQWLCNADTKQHNPVKRMYTLFSTLYSALRRGAKAVLQVYPENSEQMELLTFQATKVGFTGGLVIDFPHSSKAKKLYLCLFTGGAPVHMPVPLGIDNTLQAAYTQKKQLTSSGHKNLFKSKSWILAKKERRRKQGGRTVRPDTKYTGRRRKGKF